MIASALMFSPPSLGRCFTSSGKSEKSSVATTRAHASTAHALSVALGDAAALAPGLGAAGEGLAGVACVGDCAATGEGAVAATDGDADAAGEATGLATVGGGAVEVGELVAAVAQPADNTAPMSTSPTRRTIEKRMPVPLSLEGSLARAGRCPGLSRPLSGAWAGLTVAGQRRTCTGLPRYHPTTRYSRRSEPSRTTSV